MKLKVCISLGETNREINREESSQDNIFLLTKTLYVYTPWALVL